MIRAKSFLFGAAAGLFAMSTGHAADLPLKAKAVEYVKVCSLYGAGFYYVPGTDTCIKLGGYLRADLTIHGNNQNGPFWNGVGGAGERELLGPDAGREGLAGQRAAHAEPAGAPGGGG